MSQQDAGLDIDYDDPAAMERELARLQAAAGQLQADPEHPEKAVQIISGSVVEDQDTVEFMGRKFRVADKIGAMPLLKFSMYSEMKLQDPKALGAMYALLRDCIYPGRPGCGTCEKCAPPRCGDCRACEIAAGMDPADTDKPDCRANPPDEISCKDYDPGDWAAFEAHAMETRAEADDLFDVINKTMEVMAGRPTRRSATSSRGPRGISGGSTGRSSGRGKRGSKR